MSRLSVSFSYRELLILKYSLKKQIESEEFALSYVKSVDAKDSYIESYKKDHEQHKRCYNRLVKIIEEKKDF